MNIQSVKYVHDCSLYHIKLSACLLYIISDWPFIFLRKIYKWYFFFTITDLLIIKCFMLQNDGSHMSTNQLIFAILLDLINESNWCN